MKKLIQILEQLINYLKLLFYGNSNAYTYRIVEDCNIPNDQVLGCKNYYEITFEDLNNKYYDNKRMIFDPNAVLNFDSFYDYNDNVCEFVDAERIENMRKKYIKFGIFGKFIFYFKKAYIQYLYKYLDARKPEFYISEEEKLLIFTKFKIKEYIILIIYFFILLFLFYNIEISKDEYHLKYEYYNIDLKKFTNIKITDYRDFYSSIIFYLFCSYMLMYFIWINIILDNTDHNRRVQRSKIRLERMKKDPAYRYRRKGDPYEKDKSLKTSDGIGENIPPWVGKL